MSIEQFLSHIKNFEEKGKHYAKLYAGFSNKLPGVLADTVFDHLPDLKKHSKTMQPKVLNIAEKYMGEIWEWFNHTYSSQYLKKEVKDVKAVPKPKTKEEAETELKNELKDIPAEHHEGYTEIFWEVHESDQRYKAFQYEIYARMKAVFVDFFMDDVMELESGYLRQFDYDIYLMCAGEFVQEIYGLMED
jgi:hypothetical protein